LGEDFWQGVSAAPSFSIKLFFEGKRCGLLVLLVRNLLEGFEMSSKIDLEEFARTANRIREKAEEEINHNQ